MRYRKHDKANLSRFKNKDLSYNVYRDEMFEVKFINTTIYKVDVTSNNPLVQRS
jgi:hypothetical protein